MYSATFTFAKRQFDDDFHALDQVIAQVARELPGYLGEQAWENLSTGLICTVYYWDSLESLQRLVEHPSHLEAKQRRAQWLDAYHVTIAQVLRSYGDGGLAHPLDATVSRLSKA